MKDQKFWLHYMVDYYLDVEETWEWAWFVDYQGQLHVKDGAIWLDTGVYCTRRTIKGCVWE